MIFNQKYPEARISSGLIKVVQLKAIENNKVKLVGTLYQRGRNYCTTTFVHFLHSLLSNLIERVIVLAR